MLTQGFIAANAAGDTVLLGRGGSDTSAAYFAAKLGPRASRFGPMCRACSAPILARCRRRGCCASLHYDEAQEIASNGAKVLHPRCVMPVRQYKIPLHVYATQAPGLEGTVVTANVADTRRAGQSHRDQKGDHAGFDGKSRHVASSRLFGRRLPGIQAARFVGRSGVDIGNQCHRVFGSHRQHPGWRRARRLAAALSEICRVEILGPCASLSLLGQNIRGILHELGSAFELFQDQKIYLVTQAANDLNFTFVIDEAQGDRLVQQLHERLIQSIGSDKVLGPTWAQLFGDKDAAARAYFELVGAAAEAPRAARYRGARVRGLCLRYWRPWTRRLRPSCASVRSSAGPMP